VFNQALFENYCRYYVDGVRNVLARFLPFACSHFTFFYPSTIFLDDPDPRFLEYMRAKQASETLCKQLQNEHPDARFVYRRLPRMRTDQTQGLIPAALQDPLEVIYKELRRMNSSYKPV
jgi:hypothetical protein